MISWTKSNTYTFKWDGRSRIPDQVFDDYADIHGENSTLVQMHERAKASKGSDDDSHSEINWSDSDDDSSPYNTIEEKPEVKDLFGDINKRFSLSRRKQIIDSIVKGLESTGVVNEKKATVGFHYLRFERSAQLQMRQFYCTDRAGNRSDEDSSLVVGILTSVLDRLGVAARDRKLVVNKFSWKQYKKFELLTSANEEAEAFGVLVEGQCELLKGPRKATDVCPQAVAPTLMRRRVLVPELPAAEERMRELEQFGRNVPTGSHFGLEAVQAKTKYTTYWQDSVVAVGPCEVLSIKKEELRFFTKMKVPNLKQRLRLLQKFPMFDEEAQHTLHLLALLMKPEKVTRGQILLKQGEKRQEVLLVNSKTHLRVLRKVTLEMANGSKQQRVVELQPMRGPCLMNDRCLSTAENTVAQSTILVSNPGTMYTLDRFALFQSISSGGMKQIKAAWNDEVSDKEIAEQYMHHVSWKKYKEDLVDDVIARTEQYSL